MKKQYTLPGFNSVYLLILSFVFVSLFTSCKKEKNDPVILTDSITSLSNKLYTVSATIVDRGDYKILDHGFVYTLARNESETNNYNYTKIPLGDTIESSTFTATFDLGSIVNYNYTDYKCFARAYITNEKGTLYGKYVSAELPVLKVTNVVPSSGSLGDTVTINGNYFSTSTFFNQVYFNDVIAQVVSATQKVLRVIVPLDISPYYNDETMTVRVTVDGTSVSLQNAFSITTSVVSFAPYSGSWSTYITVNGAGLYNASLYFDNIFVENNQNYSNTIQASVPYNIGKKQFRLYVHKNGEIFEVPGGDFVLNDLVVNPLGTTSFYPGSDFYITGQMFNPENSMNKLMLGNVTTTAYSGYSSSLYFSIPNSMPAGSYKPRITNGLDTVTLSQTIQILQ